MVYLSTRCLVFSFFGFFPCRDRGLLMLFTSWFDSSWGMGNCKASMSSLALDDVELELEREENEDRLELVASTSTSLISNLFNLAIEPYRLSLS